MDPATDPQERRSALGEVATLFVKLGVIGFGGPAAHIAMMRDEVVRRRGWLDDGEFLEYVGATNLVPGPNSTELAIHLGHRRAGARGLLVAGVCFIMPAVVIVGFLAWLYARYGTEPAVLDLRYGILPVIIAIVAHAVVGLSRTALRGPVEVVTGLGALGAYLAGVHELVILVVGGLVALAWHARTYLSAAAAAMWFVPGSLAPFMAASGRPDTPVSSWRLLAVFLEIGSVLYGSGYVLLAFLQRDLVDGLGWLTSEELLDAITVGQITPGPVFTTATFVGWQIDGPVGAAVATFGIFAPSFVFVALLARIVRWTRRHPGAKAFLGGVTVASLGLMAGVLVDLVDVALVDAVTVVIALVALGALITTGVNSAWLVLAGAVVGVGHAVL